jgi:hypothetical protein
VYDQDRTHTERNSCGLVKTRWFVGGIATAALALSTVTVQPAAAVTNWVTNTGGYSIRLDDSSQSPVWVGPGRRINLNASGRRARVEAHSCVLNIQSIWGVVETCNSGSSTFYHNFKYAYPIQQVREYPISQCQNCR